MCDTDIEQFVKDNREKIEEILARAEKDPGRKVEDAMKKVFAALMSPEVQKHFLRAGLEAISGIEAIVRNIPVPDKMKDAADKAREARENVKDVMCEVKGCKTSKGKKVKKIEVE
jgi:hypothetical protein